MITVAYANTREPSAAELSQLPREERTREFRSPERRRQFLSARLLLRALLSRFDGSPPGSHHITRGEKGKPVCKGGPGISITHAGEHVACCVTDSGDAGIDLEVIDPRRHTHKLAHRFFSPAEADWLETQPRDRFFMLWVLKEAYGKATGDGVVGAFKGLQCTVEPPRIEVLATEAGPLSLRLLHLHNSYLAIAGIDGAPGDLEIERWDIDCGDFVVDDRAIEVARN